MTAAQPPLARGADLRATVAVVPVRSLETAKSRLGEPLDAEEREAFVAAMLRRAVRAGLDGGLADVLVVSPDPEALELARMAGATPLHQASEGLNEGLADARAAAMGSGATALLVLPTDLPALSGPEVARLVERAARAVVPGRPLVALVPDRHASGTNALLVSPPDAIPFRFGEGSRARHAAAADEAGATYLELDSPLALDIDTADDLLLADLAGLDHEGGR
ncbi:MAG TPA: 2-phospho-L-lactate guanylyltransferase [Candidatus Limnocylindrales bacterium]